MSLLRFCALIVVITLLSMSKELSEFIINILICVLKMNEVLRVWNDMRVSN